MHGYKTNDTHRDGTASPSTHAEVFVRVGEPARITPDAVLSHPIDVDAFLAGIPAEACTKGHFVNQLAAHVQSVRPEAYPAFRQKYPEEYGAFQDVPFRDTLRRGFEAACLAHPAVAPSEALRRMGRDAWNGVLRSMLGRAMFAALGSNLDLIYRTGARAYEMFELRATRVTYTRFGDRHFRYDFRNCYNWIDSYQVGVLEGAALAVGRRTVLTVLLSDLYTGSIECRWD